MASSQGNSASVAGLPALPSVGLQHSTPLEDTYSTEGPICPHCKRQFTADEAFYYDESFVQMDCDDCGRTFSVMVHHETSWICEPMANAFASNPEDGQ